MMRYSEVILSACPSMNVMCVSGLHSTEKFAADTWSEVLRSGPRAHFGGKGNRARAPRHVGVDQASRLSQFKPG